MPIVPQEPAKKFRLGYKKENEKGDTFYVVQDKNKTKKWMKEKIWFVIYKGTGQKWTYAKKDFAKNWNWGGGGTTVPLDQLNQKTKYPMEEQFLGNPQHANEMKLKLKKYFQNLKKQNKIEYFRIVSVNGLHKYMKNPY